MTYTFKLYTLNNQFIKETLAYPDNFTGILEYPNGSKEWYTNGLLNRLDGPAAELIYGTKSWWIKGQYIKCANNEQFLLFVDLMKLKGLI